MSKRRNRWKTQGRFWHSVIRPRKETSVVFTDWGHNTISQKKGLRALFSGTFATSALPFLLVLSGEVQVFQPNKTLTGAGLYLPLLFWPQLPAGPCKASSVILGAYVLLSWGVAVSPRLRFFFSVNPPPWIMIKVLFEVSLSLSYQRWRELKSY